MNSKSSSVIEECFTFLKTTSLAIPDGPHIERKSPSLDSNRLQMPHDKKKGGCGQGEEDMWGPLEVSLFLKVENYKPLDFLE